MDFQHRGRFFQPFGENTFSKNAPKTTTNPYIAIPFKLIELRSRTKLRICNAYLCSASLCSIVYDMGKTYTYIHTYIYTHAVLTHIAVPMYVPVCPTARGPAVPPTRRRSPAVRPWDFPVPSTYMILTHIFVSVCVPVCPPARLPCACLGRLGPMVPHGPTGTHRDP